MPFLYVIADNGPYSYGMRQNRYEVCIWEHIRYPRKYAKNQYFWMKNRNISGTKKKISKIPSAVTRQIPPRLFWTTLHHKMFTLWGGICAPELFCYNPVVLRIWKHRCRTTESMAEKYKSDIFVVLASKTYHKVLGSPKTCRNRFLIWFYIIICGLGMSNGIFYFCFTDFPLKKLWNSAK